MSEFMEKITTVVLAIIGLAIVATLVSRKANTSGVIQAASSGLANNIAVAQSPVTGTSLHLSLGYPNQNDFSNAFG